MLVILSVNYEKNPSKTEYTRVDKANPTIFPQLLWQSHAENDLDTFKSKIITYTTPSHDQDHLGQIW